MVGRTAGWMVVAVVAGAVMHAPAAAQQTAALGARDRALSERPAAVYTVGAADGESWEMFSGIMSMAFDRSDNLYVLDSQNTRVVVFSPAGRFVRQFGRRGSGPGELQAPISITVAADGNLVVNDVGNRALVVFRPTGEHVRNVPFAMDGTMPMGPIHADGRGGVVARASGRIAPDAPAPQQATIFRQPLEENAPLSTLARFDVPPPQMLSPDGNRRIVVSADPVFSARASFGVLPDNGIALHHGDDYAVRIHDASGRHVRTLTRPLTPRRVTKRDRDAFEERSRANQGRGAGNTVMVTSSAGGDGPRVSFGGSGGGGTGGGGAALPIQIDRQFAEVMSVITGIRTDPLGRIWIQRRNADGTDAGPIDLADANGRYIGTLPAQPLPGAVSTSGLAAWVVRDDMGIERVSVRRLPQSWR